MACRVELKAQSPAIIRHPHRIIATHFRQKIKSQAIQQLVQRSHPNCSIDQLGYATFAPGVASSCTTQGMRRLCPAITSG
ncbi:hypothetical protein M747DRAFT_98114 [Aspergillus niger ATCC 13496]|uniref:Uncharacterized protein n=1 Tax=Aspergillus niger ATCC 13496 TaxID=1353008 RepID=A0A370BW88_ASPNG|nr:hypothetical protein M747DRAFT_98114 [Aspergillus niger ATCC 13496]